VLSVFYEHQARQGKGPVTNPVPAPASGMRRYAHHDPLDPYRQQQRAPYRQRVVGSPPRPLSEDVVNLWVPAFHLCCCKFSAIRGSFTLRDPP
jgi:integrase/recombinase XerD